MRAAFSSIVANTGCNSPCELEMTRSTSAVAVCCSSDSRSSLNSRTFSMAITAWSAKVFTSAICLSVKGRTDVRSSPMTPITAPSRKQRHAKHRAVFPDPRVVSMRVFWIGHAVRNVHDAAFESRSADQRAAIDANRMFSQIADVVRLGIIRADDVALAVLQPEKDGIFRGAKLSRGAHDRFKNGLDIRSANSRSRAARRRSLSAVAGICAVRSAAARFRWRSPLARRNF